MPQGKPLVPHTPTIDIDYDKYGHCVSCHRYLLMEKVIDGKVTEVNHPDYSEDEFLLDDGSRMRVAICTACRHGLTEKDYKKIMVSVIKGWRTEIQYLEHWTDEMRTKHMAKYSKRTILMKSTNVHPEITDIRLQKHREKIRK